MCGTIFTSGMSMLEVFPQSCLAEIIICMDTPINFSLATMVAPHSNTEATGINLLLVRTATKATVVSCFPYI